MGLKGLCGGDCWNFILDSFLSVFSRVADLRCQVLLYWKIVFIKS